MTTEGELNQRADRLAERLRQDGFIVTLAEHITADDAAKVLGVSTRTLRSWRKVGNGPRCVVAGRTWYPVREIVRYLDSQLTPAAESGNNRK